VRSLLYAATLFAVFGTSASAASDTPATAVFAAPERVVEGLHNPTDLVYFQGKYVAAEALSNTLAVFDDLSLAGLRRFDPASVGEKLASPHHLAVSPWGSLLITEGWGGAVVEIRDLQGTGWQRFRGIGKPLHAPHGICVSGDGWIHVADSLNSRLVRFRDMAGRDWQVFADLDRRISYGRQLVCENGNVWISNSYERRSGLNPGDGANILQIADFSSGRARVMVSVSEGNITGILPLASGRMWFGLWGWDRYRMLAVADTARGTYELVPGSRSDLGVPYGIARDPATGRVLVTYLGSLKHGGSANYGGIAVFRGLTVP